MRYSVCVFLWTVAFSSQAFAQATCYDVFHKTRIDEFKQRYDDLATPRFLRQLEAVEKLFPDRNKSVVVADQIIAILRDSEFRSIVEQRLRLLSYRPFAAEMDQKIRRALQQVEPVRIQFLSDKDVFLEAFIEENSRQTPFNGQNYKRAYRLLRDWSQQSQPLTLAMLSQMNHIFNPESELAGQIYSEWSFNYFIRKGRTDAEPRDLFLNGGLKKRLLSELVYWLNENMNKVHPVYLAAKAREIFISIHPYDDGNGRVARWLADYILVRNGYPPATIPSSEHNPADFVGLLSLREFDDQPLPGRGVGLVIDGVATTLKTMGYEFDYESVSD